MTWEVVKMENQYTKKKDKKNYSLIMYLCRFITAGIFKYRMR